jgi:hypothetical protein
MHFQVRSLLNDSKAAGSEVVISSFEDRRVAVAENSPVGERVNDRDHEMPSGRQDPCRLVDDRRHIGHVHQHVVGDDAVEGVIGKWQVGCVSDIAALRRPSLLGCGY